MKKPVIFIYDNETGKLIQVCDVRDLTSEQFAKFSTEAKKNLKEKLKEETEKKLEFDATYDRDQKNIGKELHDLKRVLKHLLGWEELDNLELESILREIMEGEKTDVQEK